MRIAVYCDHVGSGGIVPSGQYGGGELLTLGYLHILNKYYDVTPVVNNGVYPAFDAQQEYGLPNVEFNWKPIGDDMSWIRTHDVFINISHGRLLPPVCHRNILVVMFPQHPNWDVSGYDTIVSISKYTATWVKRYWGRDSHVVYPPLPIKNTAQSAVQKFPQIVNVGRFFRVPGGNNKNHEVVIKAFKDLMLADWRLKLIGSIQDRSYYNELRAITKGDDRIEFLHDLSRQDYIDVMSESRFLWAATGYNAMSPASQEHFGITAAEAIACGTVPIVHNSGGTPEIGAITWDNPNDLVSKTRDLIDDQEQWMSTIQGMMGQIARFDISNEDPLLNVLEAPLIIPSDPQKGKAYIDYPKPKDVKIGLISDSPSPQTTTGFGTNATALVNRWLDMGFRVAAFGRHDPPTAHPKIPPEDILSLFNEALSIETLVTDRQRFEYLRQRVKEYEPCTIWRDPRDGWDGVIDFVKHEKPDVLFINYDFGNVRTIIDILRSAGDIDIPSVVYVPVEGKPVLPQYVETLRLIRILNGIPITYTRTGVQAITEVGGPRVDFVYHGADHAKFQRLPDEQRQHLRTAVGWQGRFVCMFVGRNKRTKGIQHLLDAAKFLKQMGRTDVLFYLHTWQYDRMPNSSAPLGEIVGTMGISDMVVFPENFNQILGIPYDKPIHIEAPDTNDLAQVQRINLQALNMVERYNLADLYTNPSEVEGFGLTAVEAMACGVPVLSVNDQGVQQEVLGEAAMYVPVAHWDMFHTGARLAQCNPEQLARAIDELSRDQETLVEFREKSLTQAKKYSWDYTADFLAGKILEQVLL
ncbi:MAG: glycosyltransferase [Candidatus Altiarchaeales archaeon]|nr:glycosyltransferase [Candidatus Altiarchaeales archaeon]